ncbi:hypothetical protein GCM10025857_14550 [Alicyclobacillus contaminans]|uniref:hypothetical protein n=1 Tax=Alicyclobacillus contaminans TaxID=392016 RepID=UPI00047D50CC|nr:hypothetical protein [Alicyclobacillus contaminans]GMA50098.1 hypothetical protein GCM10025857_14550 [Alicyclobacillus contaminans]
MPTFFSSSVQQRLFDFALSLAAAARLFTAEQLARHADLSGYRDPTKRAREFLARFPDTFETLRSPAAVPARRRLTAAARRRYGITTRPVSGVSKRADHWLGIGDIWLELTFYGGRPTEWRTEPDGQFDIYCEWQGRPLLIEYQRTPIAARQWRKKWERRLNWYRQQTWSRRPTVILIDTTGQCDETLSLPRGTVHVRRIEDLHHALMPPRL